MKKVLTLSAVALIVLTGACGSSGKDDNPAVATDDTATTIATSDNPGLTTADANSASESELVAALEAHGVPSASRWAHEIEEYRPYPTDDPSLAKLKQNLAKYNPGDEVLANIIASLTV
jgi:hypothetical protein